ncbi:hypothetical protein M0419_23670 [Pseudomonas aeruginosa]|uniref:hypothetical protein n=1 Tax=Pseudomonas aeruginosa TaxID=287 RepID=UPI0020959211|nr:hypothetical protein [Pseudomonas aeruginosa]USV19768.1 hypothetical protein M0419_23670 [Pseudomonas aeruginosa]
MSQTSATALAAVRSPGRRRPQSTFLDASQVESYVFALARAIAEEHAQQEADA